MKCFPYTHLFVDCFEVAQVTLMVERFTKLLFIISANLNEN